MYDIFYHMRSPMAVVYCAILKPPFYFLFIDNIPQFLLKIFVHVSCVASTFCFLMHKIIISIKEIGDYANTEIDAPVIIPAIGHRMNYFEMIDSTCTTIGKEAYWSCSNCKKYFTDEDIFVERCARNGMSFNQEYKLKYGGENMGIDYRLGSIIEFILEVANERLDEVPSPRVNGELIGYAEALKIIQEQLTDDERKRFKLDFDIDKKYM